MFAEREQAKNAQGTLRRLIHYVGRQRRTMAIVVALVVLAAGLGLLGPT